MNAADLFSKSYAEARSRFLSAAHDVGAEVDTKVLGGAGPAGEMLAMDFAVLGAPDAPLGLVVVSGTHGPEGYCGSACQLGLLTDADLRAEFSDMRVVLVHAHNPFGFAFLHRTTEENVDLNRNYFDPATPLPANPGYAALADAITPRDIDDPAANARLAAYKREFGTIAYVATVMGGQHSHPDGLFYGGTRPTWSNISLAAGLQQHLAHQRSVCLIDIHTGLGPYGVPCFIHGYAQSDPRTADMAHAFGEFLRSADGDKAYDEALPTEPRGILVSAVDRILPGRTTYSYVIEYGTYSPEELINALRTDNWLHVYGDLESARGRAIKTELRRVMYPEFDDWKEMIWEKARWALSQSADLLKGQHSNASQTLSR